MIHQGALQRSLQVGVASLLIGLGACASGPAERPVAAIARAEANIDNAEKAGARAYGAADLDAARDKLTRARMLADEGDEEVAARLAEQAAADAELAGAKGLHGKAGEALAQLRESTRTLREEAMRPSPPATETAP